MHLSYLSCSSSFCCSLMMLFTSCSKVSASVCSLCSSSVTPASCFSFSSFCSYASSLFLQNH